MRDVEQMEQTAMTSKAKARKLDLRGRVPESWCCVDCGVNTFPGAPTREEAERQVAATGEYQIVVREDAGAEVYTVHLHVWEKTELGDWGGCLCIGCLEKRIGRRLMPDDFPMDDAFQGLPGTPRLLDRRGRCVDVLGDWQPAAEDRDGEMISSSSVTSSRVHSAAEALPLRVVTAEGDE